MTATHAYQDRPRAGHPLQPGAAPHDIRAHLLPEDRAAFDAAFADALAGARRTLDLTELFRTLEHWRRTAILQSDPAEFRRVVHRAAELLTGKPVPDDEPFAVTRSNAGMQVYRVETDARAQQQIAALPNSALAFCAELRTLLEVDPWCGDPVNKDNPDAEVRTLTFGRHREGLVTNLILEDQRCVHLLQVAWIG